jgi:hypothetical protein
MSALYVISPTASIEVKGSHSWIHQDDSAFLPVNLVPFTVASVPPSLDYQAWMVSTTANIRF